MHQSEQKSVPLEAEWTEDKTETGHAEINCLICNLAVGLFRERDDGPYVSLLEGHIT